MDTSEQKRLEAELAELLDTFEEQVKFDRLGEYEPGRSLAPTAKQLEFHAAGKQYNERCLGAGNQTGKSLSGAAEVAMHMTGRYPDWWEGLVLPAPPKVWVAGVTGISTRDNPQRHLLGEKRQWGTGMIPKEALHGDPVLARGLPDAVDSFQVKWGGGGDRQQGISLCWFKSYEQGREKWQGETLHLIWYDEEPPWDIYDEGQTRLVRHRGSSFLTFTPLRGMTDVVRLFYEPDTSDPGHARRKLIQMDLRDATFYTRDQMDHIEAGWEPHVRRARARGLPMIGSGLIYPYEPEVVPPFKIPDHYRVGIGLDLGVDHPTAAVKCAYDPDNDVIYVVAEYKAVDPEPLTHAEAVKRLGGDRSPVFWPHDALKGQSAGMAMKDRYAQHGCNMFGFSARYHDDKGGGQGREPIISEILERIKTKRLKVVEGLREFDRERRSYHRKDGQPVDYMDDVISALHYAVMMRRHWRPAMETPRQTHAIGDYDVLGGSEWPER